MELWTVEWSSSQGCFHIDPLKRTLERNLMAFIEKRSNDYQILVLAKSQDEAHQLASNLEQQQGGHQAA